MCGDNFDYYSRGHLVWSHLFIHSDTVGLHKSSNPSKLSEVLSKAIPKAGIFCYTLVQISQAYLTQRFLNHTDKALILVEHFTLTFLYVNFSKGIHTLQIFSIVEFHHSSTISIMQMMIYLYNLHRCNYNIYSNVLF